MYSSNCPVSPDLLTRRPNLVAMALCAMLGGCGGPGAGGPGVANAGDATANTQCGADLQRDPNDPYISGQHPQFPRHKFITGAGESSPIISDRRMRRS